MFGVITADGEHRGDLARGARAHFLAYAWPGNVRELRNAVERTLIEGALKQAGQNKSKAARLLGLSRGKLYTLMERFGLA